MRYALVINETEEDITLRESESVVGAWKSYLDALVAAGVMRGGTKLSSPDTATTLRLRAGRREIHDGPFADTRELLGGFVLIEVDDLDQALAWAARCPTAMTGSVEVRPVAEGP